MKLAKASFSVIINLKELKNNLLESDYCKVNLAFILIPKLLKSLQKR